MTAPLTGELDAVQAEARELLPAAPPTGSAFRQRYGVVHNPHGPRIRLGIAWMILVFGSFAAAWMRPYGLATVYAVAAGLAALQVVDAWQGQGDGTDRYVAAFGASFLPIAATVGTRELGAGLILLVATAVGVALSRPKGRRTMPVFAAAGHTVLAAGLCGGAAASLVLLANYEIGAVIILLVYVMVYDASDFIVGSGSTNGIEGPIAGGVFICAATMVLAVFEVPPFRGADIWTFAALTVIACPVGQIVASAMLPRADATAPALRRIDSLLIAAPAWAGLLGIYLQQTGG